MEGQGLPAADTRHKKKTEHSLSGKVILPACVKRGCETLNFLPGRDLRIGISVDGEAAQLLTVLPAGFNAENGNRDWEETVRNSTRYVKGKITVREPGYHTLKIWMIDPGMVLEKIVVNTGGLRPSYLGPPESYFRQQAIVSRQ